MGFTGGAGFATGAANFVGASGAFCSVAAGVAAGAAGFTGAAGTIRGRRIACGGQHRRRLGKGLDVTWNQLELTPLTRGPQTFVVNVQMLVQRR